LATATPRTEFLMRYTNSWIGRRPNRLGPRGPRQFNGMLNLANYY
jgi:hypothetical protein